MEDQRSPKKTQITVLSTNAKSPGQSHVDSNIELWNARFRSSWSSGFLLT